MELVRLTADEAAVRRFLEDLWVPYNRELEAIVDGFALADGVDVVAEELGFRMDRLDEERYRAWVAVDGHDHADGLAADDGSSDESSLADVDGELVGFVATDVDECPSSFERPDRLVVCDVYVREPHRGTGVASDLFERAGERARETGCEEFKLEVDVGNDRAIAFYEKLGFETIRHTMVASVDEK